MRFFRKNTVSIKKVEKEDTLQYFIDYNHHKEPDVLWSDILTAFTKEKRCLLVIDTDRLYDRSSPNMENKINMLTNNLVLRQIPWHQIVTKKESDLTILGLKIQNQPKRICYQVGVAVIPEKIKELLELVRDYTVFIFVYEGNFSNEMLIEQFIGAKGELDELSAGALIALYNDRFLNRLVISSHPDKAGLIDETLAGLI